MISALHIMILAAYCAALYRYYPYKKKVALSFAAALALTLIVLVVRFHVFYWSILSLLGKLAAAAITRSLPLLIATAAFALARKKLQRQYAALWALVSGSILLLPIIPISATRVIALIDIIGVILTCSFTGDCL